MQTHLLSSFPQKKGQLSPGQIENQTFSNVAKRTKVNHGTTSVLLKNPRRYCFQGRKVLAAESTEWQWKIYWPMNFVFFLQQFEILMVGSRRQTTLLLNTRQHDILRTYIPAPSTWRHGSSLQDIGCIEDIWKYCINTLAGVPSAIRGSCGMWFWWILRWFHKVSWKRAKYTGACGSVSHIAPGQKIQQLRKFTILVTQITQTWSRPSY